MGRTQHDLPIRGQVSPWRLFVLWLRQGRPRDMPVVVEAGRAIIREDGMMVLVDWTLAFQFVTQPLDVTPHSADLDRLWAYVVAKGYAEVEWMGVEQWQKMRPSQT